MKLPALFNKNIVSIDIGSYETKIIEGKISNNTIQVHKAFSISTPKGCYKNGYIKNDKALIDAIKEGLKKNKICSRTTYLTIKSTDVITREIPFPVLNSKEIEGMLKYQLEEYLPMDSSKYVIQHKIIGRDLDLDIEKLKVLVVSVPKEIVEKHFFLLKELNLKPAVLDYQSNSMSKLIRYAYYVNEDIAITEKTIVAIDLGYDSTYLTVINNGVLQANRVIEIGGEYLDNNILNLFQFRKIELLEKKNEIEDVSIITGDDSVHNCLVNVAKTSIENIIDKIEKIFKYYYAVEAENEIQMLLLYGGLSKIKGVDKLFTNYFSIPTIIINKIGNVNIDVDGNKYLNCISTMIRDYEEQNI